MSVFKDGSPAPGAIVIYAASTSFPSGRILQPGRLQSRCLTWCRQGSMTVVLPEASYTLKAGSFILIPWNQVLDWRVGEEGPAFIAGIHLIPDFKMHRDINYTVYFSKQKPRPDHKIRKDADLPGLESAFAGLFSMHYSLEMLAEYILKWFRRGHCDEFMARNLAQTLIYELMEAKKLSGSGTRARTPGILLKLQNYIEKNIKRHIGLSELGDFAGISRSTLFRLFRTYLECTPSNWILKRKVFHAGEMLTETNMRVSEIGETLGIEDPYYFSRVFRKFKGMSAREYRKANSLI